MIQAFEKNEIYLYDIERRDWDLADNKTKAILPNQEDQKIRYSIFNRGMANFKLTEKFKAEDMIFFDIETAPYYEDFHNKGAVEDPEIYLKMDRLILTCFSLVFGEKYNLEMIDILMEAEKYLQGEKKVIIQRGNGISIYCENAEKLLITMLALLSLAQKKRKSKKKLMLIGHNALKFDSYLFNHVPEYMEPKTDTHSEAKEKILSWKLNGMEYTLGVYDTLAMGKAFGCGSVEKMGKVVGAEKLSYSAHESAEAYAEYCLRDSEIVYKFVKQEINGHGIYDLNPARYARNYFYNKLFSSRKNLESLSTSANINNFQARAARTEAYFKEIENSFYVDANSLYPTAQTCLDMVVPAEYPAMKKGENGEMIPKTNENGEPITRLHYTMTTLNPKGWVSIREKLSKILKEIKEMNGVTPEKLRKLYDTYFKDKFYLLKVRINGIRPDFGDKGQIGRLLFYFPFVLKKNGRTIFRLEKGEEYQVGFYEMLFLSFFDYEIKEVYVLDKGEGIFTPFVKELYEQRRKKKELKQPDKFEKLVLNSGGYGIFIIRNRETKRIENSEVYKFFNEDSEGIEYKENIKKFGARDMSLDSLNLTTPRYFRAGGRIFEPKFIGNDVYSVEESPQQWIETSIPVLGLNILSNSRFFMYSFYLNVVFSAKYRIYYTDTDSLFCNEELYKFIQDNGYDGKELGQFKLEYEVDKAFFLAPKAYVTLHKENGEIKVGTTLKGTGEAFLRTIVANRKFKSTLVYQKKAFNPTTIQKRAIDKSGQIYLNQFSSGNSEEWIKQYHEFMEKVVEYYQIAIAENKKNGFDTSKYERDVEELKHQIEIIYQEELEAIA